jgi:hypothetical protein
MVSFSFCWKLSISCRMSQPVLRTKPDIHYM